MLLVLSFIVSCTNRITVIQNGQNTEVPVARLAAYPESGNGPLPVSLDASGSWAQDGSELSFDWDINGDGEYELIDQLATLDRVFDDGEYQITVRVTDGGGLSSTATVILNVTGGLVNPSSDNPVINIQYNETIGVSPVTVTLDLSATVSPSGQQLHYDYDFDNDGVFDTIDGGSQTEHLYTEHGIHNAKIRAYDDLGNESFHSVEIAVITGLDQATAGLPQVDAVKWQNNAEAALSLAFDDGTLDHWQVGLPLWDQYGFKVTLGIIAQTFNNKPDRIPQLQEAFNRGHELANHSTTHPDFRALSQDELILELATCKHLLLDNVDGLKHVPTVIYPMQYFDDDVIATLEEEGYFFARSGDQGISDYAAINDADDPPFLHLYSWANQANLPYWMWDSVVDAVVEDGGWQIEQCHGIGEENTDGVGYSPRPLSEFQTHYDHIQSYGDRLWVAPIGEVGCYVMERSQAQLIILSFTSSEFEFLCYDGLPNDMFNTELTVRVQPPSGWDSISVIQGDTNLVNKADTNGGFLINITPGNGVIKVSRTV